MAEDVKLKKHFEANMLDGDEIQDGQMLSSASVFEYLAEVVAEREKAAEKYGRADELVKLSDWGKTIDDQWNSHFEKRLADLNQSQDKETK